MINASGSTKSRAQVLCVTPRRESVNYPYDRDSFLIFFPPLVEKIILDHTNAYSEETQTNKHIVVDRELLYSCCSTNLQWAKSTVLVSTLHDSAVVGDGDKKYCLILSVTITRVKVVSTQCLKWCLATSAKDAIVVGQWWNFQKLLIFLVSKHIKFTMKLIHRGKKSKMLLSKKYFQGTCIGTCETMYAGTQKDP